jgi:hypothetical protein
MTAVVHGARVRVRENVVIEVRDRRGRCLRRERRTNLVTTAGLNLLRDLLDASQGPITHFAVGTSGTAPASGNTALGAEVYRNVVSQRDKPANGQIVHRCFVPTTAANGSTLREAGLFNAASGGSLFSRIVYSDIVKTNSISVTITWTHTFS